MKKVVVTGATSFLGRNIISRLLDKGYYIYAFVRKDSADLKKLTVSERIKVIYGDMEHIEVILDYVDKADYFLHFAWNGSGPVLRGDKDIQFKNVDYSVRALQVAEKLNCRKFLFPGSQAEYGPKFDLISEETVCNPVSPYGMAKLMFGNKASDLCKSLNVELLHLRIFSVYGFGDRKGTLIDMCINAFLTGDTVKLGPCRQKWNYLYIDDFVEMTIMLLENDKAKGVFNIAGIESEELFRYVSIIHELCDNNGKYVLGTMDNNPEGSPNLIPNISKLLSYIGNYDMIDFKTGIRNIINSKGNIE